MVDYIAEYLDTIRKRRVFPDVTPGYMRQLVPSEAPMKGEKWADIIADVETVIMPGVSEFNYCWCGCAHPGFYAGRGLLNNFVHPQTWVVRN